MVKHSCSVCSKACRTDCIYCESCQNWLHYSCENINSSLRTQWQQIPLTYICSQCRGNEDGSYDYLMGSDRLKKAADQGIKGLKQAVDRERLFLENVPLDTDLHSDFSTTEQDNIANYLLTHFHCSDKTALQANETEIMSVRRLYLHLKASTNDEKFKKRVTWIENSENLMPEINTNVAVVEYVGNFPGVSYHGGVKNKTKNSVHIRTKPHVRATIKQKLKNKSVKEVERELNHETSDDFDKQRNEKQLRNIKHEIVTETATMKTTSNVADQVICVEELVKTHDFVQSVKHIKGMQHPVVTLFTQQQINDIKRFCCRDNVVLGMDKTYNLGDFHVTPTVYKDMSVLRRTTNDHPICFGPTFIHQSSTTKAYQAFLHDIADNLTDIEISNLVIGSDEEFAFKSAIKRSFYGCTHVLCTRHLKENTNRQMENNVGYPKSERDEILRDIYGEHGLCQLTDIDAFNYKVSQLQAKIVEKDGRVGEKKFLPYFRDKLLPLLKEHVIGPMRNGKITACWTNNNCESANHVLKTATQWKMQDMPKFINTLHGIVKSELEERCRAIRDTGNYRLSDKYVHHKTEISFWETMTEECRQKRVRRFLTDCGKINQNTVVSTNGQRTAQKTPTAGRKPHQIKRKRAERSVTPNAKRRL